MIQSAAEAGADVVKFQTFSADRLTTATAPKARYQLETTDRSESQIEMLRRLELPDSAYDALRQHCEKAGIEFLSSPFDEESVDLLERVGVKRYKIPSGELINHPLLRHVGQTGKPVILSTGMSSLGEVEAAVRVLEDAGCSAITLLHCTSSYPTDPAETNLRAMQTLRTVFGMPVGFSDHTRGIEIACAAVALGATLIEKHFTLDRGLPGPDQSSSLEPDELAALVTAVRNVSLALGDGIKRPTLAEFDTRDVARKSLVAARDLEAGTEIAPQDVCAKRPGTGISPADVAHIVGRRLRVALPRDELISWKHLT
jgi:N-acetylneuraminate synthase